jgi:hypothetical protein
MHLNADPHVTEQFHDVADALRIRRIPPGGNARLGDLLADADELFAHEDAPVVTTLGTGRDSARATFLAKRVAGGAPVPRLRTRVGGQGRLGGGRCRRTDGMGV